MKRHLRRPAAKALIGTLIGSVPGFILPFAVADHFGVGRNTDAYVYALAIATFGLTLSYAVLEANVLPVAQMWLNQGRHDLLSFARRTARQAFFVVGIAEVPIAAIGIVVLLSRHGWSVGERNLSIATITIFFALVAICGVSCVLGGCLYALNDFVFPTTTQAFRSVVPLCGLLVLGANGQSVKELAGLVVAGETLRALVLALRLRARSKGLEPQPKPNQQLLSVWRAAGPAAIGIVVLAANPIVDRSVAARFGPGSVTILDLGEKIFYVPFTIVQASVVLVAGARWAHIAASDRSLLRPDFFRSLRLTIGLSVILMGVSIVALFIGSAIMGKNIDGVSIESIRNVSVYFLIGLPGAVTWLLCGRFLTISQQTHLLPIFAIVGLTVNFFGDLVGAAFIQVDGVALGSSLVSYVTAALSIFTCRRLLDHDFPRNPFRTQIKSITPATTGNE